MKKLAKLFLLGCLLLACGGPSGKIFDFSLPQETTTSEEAALAIRKELGERGAKIGRIWVDTTVAFIPEEPLDSGIWILNPASKEQFKHYQAQATQTFVDLLKPHGIDCCELRLSWGVLIPSQN